MSNCSRFFDFLIVGGGPAGSACATMLARAGARVAVVESGNFSRFRIGETIEASARGLLVQLRLPLDDTGWIADSDPVASVWESNAIAGRSSITNPWGRGLVVDRCEFDRRLFQNAGAAGATLFQHAQVIAAQRRAGTWRFTIAHEGLSFEGRTPLIIEATGRTGQSLWSTGASRMWVDRLVGIAVRVPVARDAGSNFAGAALIEAAPCGWWYSVYLPDDRKLAVFFTDGDLLPRTRSRIGSFLQSQLRACDYTRDRCYPLEARLPSLNGKVFDARSSLRRTAARDGAIAVGDALVALDPLCGRGVVTALNAAIELGECLLAGTLDSRIAAWIDQVGTRFNHYLAERSAIYSSARPSLRSAFWQRRCVPNTLSGAIG